MTTSWDKKRYKMHTTKTHQSDFCRLHSAHMNRTEWTLSAVTGGRFTMYANAPDGIITITDIPR